MCSQKNQVGACGENFKEDKYEWVWKGDAQRWDNQLKKVNAEYLDFIRTKSVVEQRLRDKVNAVAEMVSSRLSRLSKTRNWNESFDNFNVKEDGVEYFTNKLDDMCFQEAEKHIKKGHKIYNSLKEKRDKTMGNINCIR